MKSTQRKLLNTRISGLSMLVVIGLATAVVAQARVQLIARPDILERARKSGRLEVSVTDRAKRGSMLTSDGKPLAQDEDARELTIDFTKVPNAAGFYMDLSAATGLPAVEFSQLAAEGVRTRTWREPVSAAQAERVQRVKSRWKADGLSLARGSRRAYPLGPAAAGFVGSVRDGNPLTGLEVGLDKALSGQNGKIEGLVDRGGSFLPMRQTNLSKSRLDGNDVVLTVDSELQLAAAAAIKMAVDKNNADQGCAIVMDPKTGDILALANSPSFDPNRPWAAQPVNGRSPDFNPNYMAALEPGSTFKILTLAKALDMGVVQPNEGFYCSGGITVRNKTMRCDLHHGTRAHGALNPERAISKSCNVCAATWALRIGHPSFVDFLDRMGLLEAPGLGLPKESSGLFNRNDYTKDIQIATVGFGQSVNTTPVALAGAFSVLANDGVRMKPRLIKSVGGIDRAPIEMGQVLKPESCDTLLKFMKSVIQSDEGTGHSLRIPGYELGGKTGTAQKRNGVGGGGYVSNFVGFVPADKPRAVILVMVDNPKNGAYYGASVAGPVFVQLARSVIRRYGIPASSPHSADVQ